MRKSLYQSRQLQGKCVNCGKRLQKKPDGKFPRMCPTCAAKSAAYQRERKQRLVEAGICPRCGAPLKEGETTCEECRAKRLIKDREVQKTRYAKKAIERAGQKIQNRENICMKVGDKHYDGEEKYADIVPTEEDLNSIGVDAKESINRCLSCEIPVEYCTGTNCVRAYRTWKHMEELKIKTSEEKK